MTIAEKVSKLEEQKAKLTQELDRLEAERVKRQEEKQTWAYHAFGEGDTKAVKEVERINKEIEQLTMQLSDRHTALDTLQGILAQSQEQLRQEKLAQAGKACLEALLAGYRFRMEIAELNKQAEAKWHQGEESRKMAQKHRRAYVDLGGNANDIYIPSDFQELTDGEALSRLKGIEARLPK
jgi:predicted RNase H-like nuclease (RuvC/YqgF family)